MLTSETLFERYFLPLYPPAARADLARSRATDANPAQNPSITRQLDDIAEVFAKMAPHAFRAPTLDLDFTDASVHRLALLLTPDLRDEWLSAPSEAEVPLIAQIVIHGSAYIGTTILRTRNPQTATLPRATWQVRSPLWESLVRLESSAGTADLAIFHWWLKSLSDDEIGKGRLLDRYRTHVEVPTFDPTSLRRIAPPDRKLPRLAKVRYDLLYKHLRAHLPELRDVGDDFPSPERFEQYAFTSLDFLLVGDGRMLILWGPTKEGLHLFWLDATGFQKSAFYPSDSFPAPLVKQDGEKLRILTSHNKTPLTHEILWWGT